MGGVPQKKYRPLATYIKFLIFSTKTLVYKNIQPTGKRNLFLNAE
ncbi:hypothetical protein MCERE19_02990 [Spirosomataceae bacterium]